MKGTTVMNHAATTVPREPHKDAVVQGLLSRTNIPSESRWVQHNVHHHVRAGGSNLNTEIVIKLLNEALGTVILSILRYKRRYFMTAGIRSPRVETMLLRHVADEQTFADRLAERIIQLGGKAIIPLEWLLKRSHAEQVEGDSLAEMLRADLRAEQSVIHDYRTLIASVGTDDLRTRQMFEQILTQKEVHVEHLARLVRD